MSTYIENLVDNVIGEENLRRIWQVKIANGEEDFIPTVRTMLLYGKVCEMRPETLGKIMCAFEIGDVMVSEKKLFEALHYSGDTEETQRELVAICLAYKIEKNLEDEHRKNVGDRSED